MSEKKPKKRLLLSFQNYLDRFLKVLLWFQVNNNKKRKIISNKANKNEISNFRPVSILNTSSKIYEKVMKNQLVSGLHKYCSPFISTYRKGYSTHHISTRLAEEWRE